MSKTFCLRYAKKPLILPKYNLKIIALHQFQKLQTSDEKTIKKSRHLKLYEKPSVVFWAGKSKAGNK